MTYSKFNIVECHVCYKKDKDYNMNKIEKYKNVFICNNCKDCEINNYKVDFMKNLKTTIILLSLTFLFLLPLTSAEGDIFVEVFEAKNITSNSVIIGGSVNVTNVTEEMEVKFGWGLKTISPPYTWFKVKDYSFMDDYEEFEAELTNLESNTTYQYILRVENEDEWDSQSMTFTTLQENNNGNGFFNDISSTEIIIVTIIILFVGIVSLIFKSEQSTIFLNLFGGIASLLVLVSGYLQKVFSGSIEYVMIFLYFMLLLFFINLLVGEGD